jgi:NAD-dependent dihydropyrimidine dehydrogenase PreA subunit
MSLRFFLPRYIYYASDNFKICVETCPGEDEAITSFDSNGEFVCESDPAVCTAAGVCLEKENR